MSGLNGSFRSTIEGFAAARGCSLADLTVMSTQTDPYRIDTPANRRAGAWRAEAWAASGCRRPIHLRGLHYALVSVSPKRIKPNGEPYRNTHEDWIWLENTAGGRRRVGLFGVGAI